MQIHILSFPVIPSLKNKENQHFVIYDVKISNIFWLERHKNVIFLDSDRYVSSKNNKLYYA